MSYTTNINVTSHNSTRGLGIESYSHQSYCHEKIWTKLWEKRAIYERNLLVLGLTINGIIKERDLAIFALVTKDIATNHSICLSPMNGRCSYEQCSKEKPVWPIHETRKLFALQATQSIKVTIRTKRELFLCVIALALVRTSKLIRSSVLSFSTLNCLY